MTQADVNERFADSQKAAREMIADAIATGQLRDNGDGTGTWLVGMDRGESIRLATGEAVTELDQTTGKVAVYSSVPMWHELGTVIEGGSRSVLEVMDAAALTWRVEKRPARYLITDSAGLSYGTFADGFLTVRTDTNVALGMVGRRYEVFQNEESFDFLSELVAQGDLLWESAGALRDGKRTFVSTKVPTDVTIQLPNGYVDQVLMFLVALNSHDGTTGQQVLLTPWRPVCGNTERFAMRDAKAKWSVPHTKSMRTKIQQARQTLGMTLKYVESFRREEQQLADAEFTVRAMAELVDTLWLEPEPEAEAAAKTRWRQRRELLLNGFDENAQLLGRTAYAAERALTEWSDHSRAIRPTGSLKGKFAAARATRILEDDDAQFKNRVHRELLVRTR